MVLRSINKTALKRLRVALKCEQQRTGKVLPPRALRFFGRLKNIDERKLKEHYFSKDVLAKDGRNNFYPGYAVRSIRMKQEKEGVVIKLPTLASKQFKVTPQEEIRFVRKMVDLVNSELSGEGVVILKPIAHPVGSFIAMQKTNLPTISDLYSPSALYTPSEFPKASKMLATLSKKMGLTQEQVRQKLVEMGHLISLKSFKLLDEKKVRLSKNYPAGVFIGNEFGISFKLKPLDADHLQIVGLKNGVIQLVPYVDAI
jgi:hypothetical protein